MVSSITYFRRYREDLVSLYDHFQDGYFTIKDVKDKIGKPRHPLSCAADDGLLERKRDCWKVSKYKINPSTVKEIEKFKGKFDPTDGSFIGVWFYVMITFIITVLVAAIFIPIIDKTLWQLVQQYCWDNPRLLSSGNMIVMFTHFVFYCVPCMLLIYGIMASMRREQDSYQQGN